jgi:CRP-like cAMP-binding protein
LETAFLRVKKPLGRDSSIIGFEMGDRAALMRSSQLFAGICVSECAQIAQRARTRYFLRNELLFLQGEPFRQLILVDSGWVKLTRVSSSGSEVILDVRGPHGTIDLPSGSTFGNHASTARAIVKCKTLTWDTAAVQMFIETIPQFSRNICSILSSQLNELQERYHEISAEKVERRLACALIRLNKQFGNPSEGGTAISMSRQELAQMTGTTLFTVSRLISKWGELGLVLPRREAVLMLDSKRLDLMSGLET